LSEFVELMLALGIMIAIATIAGNLSIRVGQPAVLGQLVVGVILGPTLIDFLSLGELFHHGEALQKTILELAELGVLLLIFSAGLEVDLDEMLKVGPAALLGGTLGVVIPVISIAAATTLFDYKVETAVFIALILAATSVSISAQVMLELGVLDRREGLALLGAAVVDDILVILGISLFIAINPGGVVTAGESREIAEVLIRVIGFFVLGLPLAWIILPRAADYVSTLRVSEGPLTVAIVSALMLGYIAEYFGGVAAITGAFIAGLALRNSHNNVVEDIEEGLHAINYAFLVPIFFVSIGLQSDLTLLGGDTLPLAIVLTLLAIVSKIGGAGLGCIIAPDFSVAESMRVGIGMVSRGEVGLIVTAIGVSAGVIESDIFAAIVFVVLITTVITPPMVRWSFAETVPSEARS
jgi:Kef-type K+ transport system membrane component KefB